MVDSGSSACTVVQSLNSPFFPPHIGAEPGRAKGESRITCVCMQVILDSLFARPGSAPMWGGKKGKFRDWTTCTVVPATDAVDGADDGGDVAGAENDVINDRGNTEFGNCKKIIIVKNSVNNQNSSPENGAAKGNVSSTEVVSNNADKGDNNANNTSDPVSGNTASENLLTGSLEDAHVLKVFAGATVSFPSEGSAVPSQDSLADV